MNRIDNWRTLFSEEVTSDSGVHLYGRGEIGETALESLEDWLRRARKRLESRTAAIRSEQGTEGRE